MNKKQEKFLEEIASYRLAADMLKRQLGGFDGLIEEELKDRVRDRIWRFLEET